MWVLTNTTANTQIYYNLTSNAHALACRFFNTDDTSVAFKKVSEYIQSLAVVRFLFDSGFGFGNQAANANLIARLRDLGFNGIVEVIYPPDIKEKLSVLFNVKTDLPDDFFDAQSNIRFITAPAFLERRKETNPLALGMTGAMDFGYQKTLSYLLKKTPFFSSFNSVSADYLNVDVFLQFSSYHGDRRDLPERIDNRLVFRNHSYPVRQVGSRYQALLTPIARGDFARETLDKSTPLRNLLAAIDKKEIYVLPIYGYTAEKNPHNLLNLLLGVRYAQLHGLSKPVVLALLFDLSLEVLNDLKKLIFSLLWVSVSKNFDDPMAAKVRSSIHNLALDRAFHTVPLSNLSSSIISSWTNDDVVLISIGKLPRDSFNYFFAYQSSVMLPSVFEGASAFNLLSTTSKRPHLYCGGLDPYWPLNFSSASVQLRNQFMNLTRHACQEPKYWLTSWKNIDVAELIGMFLLQSQDPESELSKFFQEHYDELLKSDRIMSGLVPAVRLANMTEVERLNVLKHLLYGDDAETRCGQPTIITKSSEESLSNVTQNAAGHGFISGLSETLRYGLQRKGYRNWVTQGAKYAAYYTTMYTWNFFSSFTSNESSQDFWGKAATSACEAGLNTGKLLAVQVGTTIASKLVSYSSLTSTPGRAVRYVSQYLRFGMFAVPFINQPVAAGLSVAAGGFSEAVTVAVGKRIVDYSVPKSQHS